MTCFDLENLWMTRFDGENVSILESPEVSAHLAACESCQRKFEGFQLLERSLVEAAPVPRATPLFIEQLTRGLQAEQRSQLKQHARTALAWRVGIAASLLLAGGLLANRYFGANVVQKSPLIVESEASQSLPQVLAHATSATWEFARESSSPAARLGAVVFQSATFSRPEISGSVEISLPDSSEVLQSVGTRVESGIKPLRGSARKAFDFLLGPVQDKEAPSLPDNRGA